MTGFTMHEGGFGVADYVLFSVLCILSCTGGFWYSVVGSTKKAISNLHDYLLGSNTMTTLPVGVSLIASYISGVTILGTAAEVYNYGSQYWLVIFGAGISCIIVVVIYLPVFCTLRLSSSYEYLEMRFDRNVRAVASILFLVDEILFLPMVVFLPALAFNQLTGVSVILIGAAMIFFCGLYTSLGGFRAVVWTDAAQTAMMFLGVALVALVGTIANEGVVHVFEVAAKSGRTSLNNWDFSPYERQTGWGAVVGGCIYWTCFNSVNQTMVQRYIALPSKRKAIVAIAIFWVGVTIIITLCVWCGLTAYVTWVTTSCDRSAAPLVGDRLFPAFVTYISKEHGMPGLSGIFLAGLFGAGLSSLSVILNACVLVVIEDILHSWLKMRLTPHREGVLARAMTGIISLITLLMLAIMEKLGGALGVATILSAIAASTTCGIFTLGMVFPWVGSRGALAGAAAGALVTCILAVGTQTAGAMGLRHLPLNVTMQCPDIISFEKVDDDFDPTSVFPLFRISYHWVAPLGLLSTLVVGAVVGWFCDDRGAIKMDAELFTPVVWRALPAAAHEGAGSTRRAREIAQAAAPLAAPLIISTVEKIEMNGEASR